MNIPKLHSFIKGNAHNIQILNIYCFFIWFTSQVMIEARALMPVIVDVELAIKFMVPLVVVYGVLLILWFRYCTVSCPKVLLEEPADLNEGYTLQDVINYTRKLSGYALQQYKPTASSVLFSKGVNASMYAVLSSVFFTLVA